MSDEELEALYAQYLGSQFEIMEMDSRSIPSGDPRMESLVAQRDDVWNRYHTGGGTRSPVHRGSTERTRSLHPGDEGPDVRSLRAALGLSTEGRNGDRYDSELVHAVETFQHSVQHATSDGHADEATLSALARGLLTQDPAHPGVYHVAGDSSAVVTLGPEPGEWVLLLENTASRTAATTMNMMALAIAAYEEPAGVQAFFDRMGHGNLTRAQVQPFVSSSALSVFTFLKRVGAGEGYHTATSISHSHTGTQGFVVDCASHVIVSMRGTEPSIDIMTDADAYRVNYPYTSDEAERAFDSRSGALPVGTDPQAEQVHYGFISAFHSVREAILSSVRDANPRASKPIFIAGHSLGGALASACAVYLDGKFNHQVPIAVTTIAQPRLGTMRMAPRFAHIPNYFRIANDGDTVPRVPASLTNTSNRFIQFGSPWSCGRSSGDGIFAGGLADDTEESQSTFLEVLRRLPTAAVHPSAVYYNQSRADVRQAIEHPSSAPVRLSAQPVPESELHQFHEWALARFHAEHPPAPPPAAPAPSPSEDPAPEFAMED